MLTTSASAAATAGRVSSSTLPPVATELDARRDLVGRGAEDEPAGGEREQRGGRRDQERAGIAQGALVNRRPERLDEMVGGVQVHQPADRQGKRGSRIDDRAEEVPRGQQNLVHLDDVRKR